MVTLKIEVIIASSGTIENIANVTANEVMLNGSNTNTSTTIYVGDVNVSIIKVSNASANPHYGDYVKYTITVENHGPINGTNVIVTDYIDTTKLRYINHTASNSTTYDNNTGIWNIGNLTPNQLVTLTLEVEIIGLGNITNTANITTNETNVNNQSSTNKFTVSDVNISIIKIANTTAKVNIGDNITYTINVTNNGLTTATGVNVIDIIDSNKLQYLNSSPSNGAYDESTGVWTIGNILPEQSAILTINVTVIGTSSVTNTANVTTNQTNINTTNRSSIVVVNISDDVDVSVVKVSNVTGSVNIGDRVEYRITVTNNGLTNATGVNVIDIIDSNKLRYLNSSASNGAYDEGTGIWTIGNLISGQSAILTINVIVIGNSSVTNTANVNTNQININTRNRSSTVVINFTKKDVNINVSVPGGNVGDIVNITLNLTDGNGNPVNTTSNVTVGGVNYTDVEFVDGVAIINYTIPEAKENITIVFDGNDKYNPVSDTVIVNFTKNDVNLSVSVPGGSVGDIVNITLNLADGNGNPVNMTANVTVGGVNYTDVEFVDGVAIISYNITGVKNNITVGFMGNDKYNGTEGTFGVNFTKGNVSLNVSVPGGSVGDIVNITLNLADGNGNPVNMTANVTVGGVNYIDVEFVDGVAVIPYKIVDTGDNIDIVFNGDENYNHINKTIDVKFTKKDVNIDINVPNTKVGHNATATITVKDLNGNSLANALIKVVLNGKSLGNFITDENGQVHLVIPVNKKNAIEVIFDGDYQTNPTKKLFEFEGDSSTNNTNNTNGTNNTNNNTTNNNSNNHTNNNSDNNSNNHTNNNSDDNSNGFRGSNITMKKTGVPLIDIILLILGIFGLISANKLRTRNNSKSSNNINKNSISTIKVVIIISLISIVFVNISASSSVDVTLTSTDLINSAISTVSNEEDLNNRIILRIGTYDNVEDYNNSYASLSYNKN
ncbi:hypothetical protein MBFIL_07130 [Methanobrevibacter filiformis]|uniref:DUF11 domain-containing protein n=2 Tax=Methanobrevibacter filiformis TaxID=55758 RepID=A0A166D683_9EURY|nr:hypothetical protein MBFIL_07130 [Methanobrevibacter filiformis]